MATRSDFAQKLLNDLRKRKERMAVSQSSSHSTRMARDVNGNRSQNYKGSRQIKTLESVGSRPANSQKRSSTRSVSIEESSRQLVPFGGGRNSEPIGDLSMALAFALENRGKLTILDSSGNSSTLSFLHHFGRRSLDMGKMERSNSFSMNQPSSRFPTLSHVHIKEISKGAQKLNQILRACSNGLNVDTYSIEIGRELLKGAMDLEESLRTLVNLQEASEYMISPQRKNRIRLLEEDEDDDNNTVKIVERKQVDRPRFSFDKLSRNSRGIKEATKTDFKQNLMALTYPSEASTLSRKQALNTSTSVSHKRSASCGPGYRALVAFSEPNHQTSSSQSKTEKGRISNVIAKLMGLEELPQNGTSKTTVKESSSKHKEGMVSKKTTNARTKNAETKTRDTANLAPLVIEKKLALTNKIPSTQEMHVTQNANSEFKVSNGKLLPKDLERADPINLVSGSRRASIAVDKQQSDIGKLYQFTGSQNDFQERVRRHDNTKQKEQIGMEMGDTKQLVQKVDAQKHKSLEGANMLQEKIGSEESTLQKEKKNAKRLPPSNQQKLKYDQVMHQQEVLQKSEPQEEKHQAEKREQQHTNQKFQGRKQNGIESAPKNPTKPMHDSIRLQKKQQYMYQAAPNDRSSREVIDDRALKGLPNGQKQEDLVRDGSSTNLNINARYSMVRNSNQNASPKSLESETNSTKESIPLLAEEKPVHVPASRRKVDRTKVHTSETPRIIDEIITRRNGTLHKSARPHKQQISVLQEMKQRRVEKTSSAIGAEQMSGCMSKEAELQNVRPKKSEASIKLLNGALPSNKESEEPPTLCGCGEAEHQGPSAMPIPTLNENGQDIALEPSTASTGSQDQVPVFSEQEQKSQRAISSPVNGADEGNIEICYLSQHEHEGILTPGMQELLTENETHLKQTLIKSQQFLNMAGALFKLNIPISVLRVTDHTSQDEDSKLILDCAFEVMKRKRRRRELVLHPNPNISIMSINITALDDLVKELHKDFENLEFYGGNGSNECNAADYLHKILDRDVQNRDPDVNCMWDLGWNAMMFAIVEKEEVIREVERHLLNGFIDEIAKDLLHLNGFY